MFVMRIWKASVLLSATWLLAATAYAQVKVQLIDPAATQAGIQTVHSPHMAMQPATGTNQHRLLLMIPGTGGAAVNMRSFDSCFAAMGYYVISLDYMNNVITTVCSKSEDSTCFDHFRQEIMFGTPVSDKVAVDSINSIVHRVTALLKYLAGKDAGWKTFLKQGTPAWDKIVVAGHSQGAGHAAFMGKHFRMGGVLLFSGPQDYLQQFHRPAGWQWEHGLTPVGRYYAFLHVRDPYVFDYQAQDVAAVIRPAAADTTMVSPGVTVAGKRQILVTDIDRKDTHGSTLSTEFVPVWRYMISNATKK